MSKDRGTDPAFPWSGGEMPASEGISILDYFAAAALTGLIVKRGLEMPTESVAMRAAEAYRVGRAMLAEREKRTEGGK